MSCWKCGRRRELLDAGANVNCIVHGSTPLYSVIGDGRELCTIARVLIARGAEVDQTSVHGDLLIPLMLAICNSSVEMVTVLLDAGATVDVPDSHNVTPLYQSCSLYEYSNRLEKARLLLARGADINWAVGETPHSSRGEYKGETPLLAAQRRGGPIERLVDDYLILFWKRARLLALGRRGSAARCRIMNDRYLAKHLGSLLIGNDVREEDA